MKRRRGLTSLIFLVVLAAVMLTFTIVKGNKPLLGLDLQGGVSVVLEPTADVDSSTLDTAIDIIEKRVNSLGIAEPEIRRQGDTIVVEIPGVKDRDRALQLVGQTAELQFRPVLAQLPAGVPLDPALDPNTTATSIVTDGSISTDSTVAGDSSVVVDPSTTTSLFTTESTFETGLRGAAAGEVALGRQEVDTTTDLTAPPSSDPTAVPEGAATLEAPSAAQPGAGQPVGPDALPPDVCETGVPPEQDQPDQVVFLPQCDPETNELISIYQLGPTLLSGESLETARKTLGSQGQWVVNPVFKEGVDGIDKFNAAAAQCNSQAASCPTAQLAVVLDGQVVSAPSINAASFQRDQIEISGQFTEKTAGELATVLRYGALPVELEPQQVQIVSATIGQDALSAGLWSALVGLILVSIYIIAFYRILGVLAMIKLVIEAALLWSVISYMGTNNGLALTLAGVTGLIVSIGVSVDSNVVYYEHMKEDVRNGRTIRSATDKSFISAWSTIVKADVSSLIGSGVLWWLTIGPVRGFAFYLGLSTLLDLLASYFYMRPAVGAATRGKMCAAHPNWFGLPSPPDKEGDPPVVQPETAGVGA